MLVLIKMNGLKAALTICNIMTWFNHTEVNGAANVRLECVDIRYPFLLSHFRIQIANAVGIRIAQLKGCQDCPSCWGREKQGVLSRDSIKQKKIERK